jgi:simple sugar transport system ATP-binding protein
MVFQSHNMIPVMTVWENVALFLPGLAPVVRVKEIEHRIAEVSDRYHLKVNPTKLVSEISIGEQQKVEILKLLLSDARVQILDEPTHVLAPHEMEAFFAILESMRKDGYAIILITHKMKDVLSCADRISVLRGGKLLSGSQPGSHCAFAAGAPAGNVVRLLSKVATSIGTGWPAPAVPVGMKPGLP